MLCIYCCEREADAREHYIPQCLGRFTNFQPLLDRLCQSCNQEIGSTLEREFCRRSPEAVLRSVHWVEGQHRGGKNKRPRQIYQPEKIGGRHLYLFAPDPVSGRTILWQVGPQPGTLKEISQLVIRDGEDEDIQHIPIPTSITTGRQLVELMKGEDVTFPVPKVLVIAASGDEERVQALFAEIGVTVPMQRRKVGRIQQQVFMGELTPAYFRALAKIGFHYALKYIHTISGREGTFRALREFIRDGTGDVAQFLSTHDTVANSFVPPGHVISAVAMPDRPLIVNMQFFAGCKTSLPQRRLTLGANPSLLVVEQISAHFFAYTEEDDGRLTGGEIVPLKLAKQ